MIQTFVFLFKIKTTQIPKYVYELILSESHIYTTALVTQKMLKIIIVELINLNTLFYHIL